MKAWVYIVLCADGLYYTGSTINLEQRIHDHNTGRFGGFTSKRLPVILLWSMEFVDIRDAAIVERQIKGWSRAKKEALMNGDTELLHRLSRSTKTKARIEALSSFVSAAKK
ncbi:MAG: GIY-YIG nuclease family protein [Bacteroidetes bacterium]|nr:GIY-YIG nuclease family protein [Bacteroidota bacterium]